MLPFRVGDATASIRHQWRKHPVRLLALQTSLSEDNAKAFFDYVSDLTRPARSGSCFSGPARTLLCLERLLASACAFGRASVTRHRMEGLVVCFSSWISGIAQTPLLPQMMMLTQIISFGCGPVCLTENDVPK